MKLKVALVHDWLTGMRGGEKVLEMFCEMFPDAPIHTLLHIPGSISELIESHPIRTSSLQSMPMIQKKYRYYLPWMPKAIESMNLSGYDLVLSTSHCVAKGCRPEKNKIHLCYCFTPMRYIWDQYDMYFGFGQAGWIPRTLMKIVRPRLQKWDIESSSRVTHFIADSHHVASRIKKYYKRESTVIYPPANTNFFSLSSNGHDSDTYLIVSALAPYKRIELAVQSFNKTGKKLKIIGSGPLDFSLRKSAKSNISFLGWQSNEQIAQAYASCKALIFPGTEDFGIVPVEAMASGKPVIAFRKGGALETVVENTTGLFFDQDTEESLTQTVQDFESMKWDPLKIRQHAESFSQENFKKQMMGYLEREIYSKI